MFRFQAVSFFAATAVVLSATPAFAASSIELTDKRSENQNGLQLIYEVRRVSALVTCDPNRIQNEDFARFGDLTARARVFTAHERDYALSRRLNDDR